MNIFYHKKRGFTLIEMLVAVSIFSVVMIVAIGALLSIIDANEKANTGRALMENVNFAMESITRNLRTGYDYTCDRATPVVGGRDCSNLNQGYSLISFLDQAGGIVRYRLSGGQIQIRKGAAAAWSNITPTEITVDSLRFNVIDAASSGQPRVLVAIKGSAGVKVSTASDFLLQTIVSQRRVDD